MDAEEERLEDYTHTMREDMADMLEEESDEIDKELAVMEKYIAEMDKVVLPSDRYHIMREIDDDWGLAVRSLSLITARN